MHLLLSILSGALFAAGIFLILRRSLMRLVLGLIFIGHAANVLIFTVGGLLGGAPPIIAEGERVLPGAHADPLPQALILTAIVISFGLFAFFLVLAKRAYQENREDDLDEYDGSDT